MKKFLLVCFLCVFTFLGRTTAKKISCVQSPKITIYMYHHIGTGVANGSGGFTPNRYYVSPTQFSQQMQFVSTLAAKRKIHLSTLAQLQQFQQKNCFPYKRLVVFTVDDGRLDSYQALYPVIKKYHIPFDYAIISDTLAITGASPYLSKDQIKEMLASGLVHIQSHSLDHANFATLVPERIQEEICNSKQVLEADFGVKINSFIYPYGSFLKSDFETLKQCGYYYGVSTTDKVMNKKSLRRNRYDLFRKEVDPGSSLKTLFNF